MQQFYSYDFDKRDRKVVFVGKKATEEEIKALRERKSQKHFKELRRKKRGKK